MSDYSKKPWIKIPLDEITTPQNGRMCLTHCWWAVTEDDCVLFFKTHGSPQCNTRRAIIERIRPDCRAVFIEVAFVPHNCNDY